MNSSSTPRSSHNGKTGPVDASLVPRYAGIATFARLPEIDDVIESGADIVMVDVQHLGGVDHTLSAVDHIKAAGRQLAFHVFPDIAAGIGSAVDVDWLEWAPLWGSAAGIPPLVNGRVRASSRPGLGIWR